VFLLVQASSAAAILGLLLKSPLMPIAGAVMMLAAMLILGRSLLNSAEAMPHRSTPEPFPAARLDLA
jgi:hypothetical protein